MEKEKVEAITKIISGSIQNLFGFKRNGQPRSVLDVIAKSIKMSEKIKRNQDKELYEALRPEKKKKKKDKKKKKNKKK